MAKNRAIKQQVVIVDSSFGGKSKEAYEVLYDLLWTTRKMANKAVATLQYLDSKAMIESGIKWNSKKKEEFAEAKARLKEQKEKFREEVGVKEGSQVTKRLKTEFEEMPPSVIDTVSNIVNSEYNSDRAEVLRGNRAVRQYKSFPIPFRTSAVRWSTATKETGNVEYRVRFRFTYKGVKSQFIEFAILLGSTARRNPDIERTIQEVVAGTLPTSDPIKILWKDGKFNVNFAVEDNVKKAEVDPDKALGVDLGMAIPAFVADQKGYFSKGIGTLHEFLRVRMQMERRKKALQKHLKYAKGGKGRKKKLKALDELGSKERNFVKTKNHTYSKAVVEQAIRARCGIIRMEDLAGFGKDDFERVDEKFKRVLRNWSYFELQTMIKYKAEKVGIKVELVDPAYTSQTCSACGHWEKGQRVSQSQFVCKSCGNEMNADKNAAINIANGGVEKKRLKSA